MSVKPIHLWISTAIIFSAVVIGGPLVSFGCSRWSKNKEAEAKRKAVESQLDRESERIYKEIDELNRRSK